MAHVHVEGETVIVRLSPWERLGAMHGDIRVPREAVTGARVAIDPWTELRGIRAPGTGIPGVVALGTRRGRFGKDFAAVTATGLASSSNATTPRSNGSSSPSRIPKPWRPRCRSARRPPEPQSAAQPGSGLVASIASIDG